MMVTIVGEPLSPSAPPEQPPVEPTFTRARPRPEPPPVHINGISTHFKIGDSLEVATVLIRAMRAAGELVYTEKTFYHYAPAYGIFCALSDADVARLIHRFTGATQGWRPSPEDEEKARIQLERWQARCLAAEAEGEDHPPAPKIRQPRLLPLNAPFVNAVMTSMIHELEDPTFFEHAAPGIAFANGFVEVRPDAIYTLPHSPAHRARFAFQFDFTPTEKSERFDTFCKQIWQDETPEEIACRKQLYLAFIGTCNLGLATRFGKAIVQYGEGSNGKTTLMEIVEGCMPGPDTITNVKPQALGGEYYRDMLAGKLLNAVEEMPEAYIEDTGPLKAAITGDYMLGRAIRRAPRRFRPIAGHLYNANKLPQTADHSAGFWRRLILVDFKRDFAFGAGSAEAGTVKDMAKHVLEEVPTILCESLSAAWWALREDAYPEPHATTELLAEWRAESDTIIEFIDTCLVTLEMNTPREHWMKSSDLYYVYNTWARQNGHKNPFASNAFRARLKQLKYARVRRADGHAYPFALKPALGMPTFNNGPTASVRH